MAAKTILIKKYENRRLYDATNSRYVNLEDVAQLVQSGNNVQVIDVASGEDITRVILTQIIAEGAKTPNSSFPLDFLRQMIIASGRATQDGAIRYTKAMLDLYQSTYKAMTPALDPFDFMRTKAEHGTGNAKPAATAFAGDEAAAAPVNTGEVDGLKQRVAELEKIVSSIATGTPKRTRAARKSTRTRK